MGSTRDGVRGYCSDTSQKGVSACCLHRQSLFCLGLTSRLISDPLPRSFPRRASSRRVPPNSHAQRAIPKTLASAHVRAQPANPCDVRGATSMPSSSDDTFFDRSADRSASLSPRSLPRALDAVQGAKASILRLRIGPIVHGIELDRRGKPRERNKRGKSRLTSCVPKPFCLGGRLGRTSEVCRIGGVDTQSRVRATRLSGRAEHEIVSDGLEGCREDARANRRRGRTTDLCGRLGRGMRAVGSHTRRLSLLVGEREEEASQGARTACLHHALRIFFSPDRVFIFHSDAARKVGRSNTWHLLDISLTSPV